jgi:sulfur-carrier protein adenylyltransferase/sulfurtransferase
MTATSEFSYDAAFERNLGWFTEAEQLTLRGKCVAIAGLGGVGGVHLITLARLGIGAFHIADFDRFSLANFN